MPRKFLGLILAVFMVLSVFSGCSKAQSSTDSDSAGKIMTSQPASPTDMSNMDPDGSVIYNIGWGPENQSNPYLEPNSDYMRHIFCSPLVMFATAADGTETMEYILAEDVICNADNTEFTIKLRPENKWHDGEPLTAHDVVYSATVLWYDDAFMYSMYYGREAIPGVWTEVDDYTVNVKYSEPYNNFLHFLDENLVIAPAHIFEGITGDALNTFNFDGPPIGSGPFKYVSHVENEYTQLERFDDYYEPALIKNLRLQYVTEDTMSVLGMKSGEIDVTRGWDAIVGELDDVSNVTVYRFPENRVDMLWFNMTEGMPYADPAELKAYARLFDTDNLCESVYGGMGVPYHSFFYPYSECADDSIKTYDFSIKKAKEFLEEGGYTLGSDGYYQKDGKRLELDFCHTQGPGSDMEKLGLVLQQNAKAAGIYMTVNNYDDDTWSMKRDNKTWDIEVDYLREGVDVTSCLNDITYFADPERRGNEHFGTYRAQVAQMAADATELDKAGDKQGAIAKARELAKLMVDEALCVPIKGYVTAYCVKNGVHIENCVYDELQFLNKMWVEKSAQ